MESVTCKEEDEKSENNPKHKRSSIKISNLSHRTTNFDLEELVNPFGPITKQYLAKIKGSGLCCGYAFVHFKDQRNAQEAINVLNGYEYDSLILTADWSSKTEERSKACNIFKHK